MRPRLGAAAASAFGFIAGGLVVGAAVSHTAPARADTTSVTQCAPGVTPCVGWQDETLNAVVPVLEILDHNGVPIFACLNAGGCWVAGDKLGVLVPTLVNGVPGFRQAVYLSSPDGVHGALVIDGLTFTRADIGMVHEMVRAHVTLSDLRWLARHG